MPSAGNRPRRYIYPPVWLALGLGAVFALNRFFPIARFGGGFAVTSGGCIVAAGLFLIIYGGVMFKIAKTEIIPFRDATALVTTGVFRISRNPMYLGMSLLLSGAAVAAGSFSSLFVVPVFMLIIEFRFIRPEETMLHNRFGAQYDAYRRSVRRWL